MTASPIPSAIAAQLRALGRVVDPAACNALYASLLESQPTDGVMVAHDLAYGNHSRHRLDIYRPQTAGTPAPVLLFLHGGAFQFGDKAGRSNVGYAFARAGIVTVLANYRLAPDHSWPAGADDVAAMIAWIRRETSGFGGNPERIFAGGESAGAVHVASHFLTPHCPPDARRGVAGLVLVSGLYDPALDARIGDDTPYGASSRVNSAYYGSDSAAYPPRSILRTLVPTGLPVFVSYADLDPLRMQVHSAALYVALARMAEPLPQLRLIEGHNHISQITAINTGDPSLLQPMLDFVAAAGN